MRMLAVLALLSGCQSIMIDTMEPCTIDTFTFWTMAIDTTVNCTNRHWRRITQEKTPIQDQLDNMIIELLEGDDKGDVIIFLDEEEETKGLFK